MKTILKSIKYISLFTLLFLALVSQAQSIMIYGYVKGQTNNLGVPNHQVIIESHIDTINNTGMNYYSSIFTANNGLFVDSVTLPYNQNVKFIISTQDCQNQWVRDTFMSMTPGVIQLQICDSGFALCKAEFLSYPDTNNHKLIHFVNTSIPGTSSFTWDFGDGYSSYQKNPTHTYAKDSTYLVSLLVADSTTGCYDLKQDLIEVKPGFYCSASFNYTSNFLSVSFTGQVNNNLPTFYKWDFGDFSTATGQNPVHSYNNAGIYKVSLQTISVNPQSYDTCISKTEKNIIIQAPPVGNIFGQVFADTGKIQAGEVVLYHYVDNNVGFLPYDSVSITTIDSLNLSFYYFHSIPYGTYLTKAKIDPQTTLSKHYGPAYHGNTFDWFKASSFTLKQGSINTPIHLTKVLPASEHVRIEGQVLEGTSKNPGDPIPGVLIYLYDVQGDVYGYTYSDMNGAYAFDNLAYRKYYIHADIINKEIIPACVWPDDAINLLTGINIYVGKEKVTSIPSFEKIYAKVFPNPTNEKLTILIQDENPNQYSIQLLDALGKSVRQETFTSNSSGYTIDVKNFTPGFYTLIIQTSGNLTFRQKLIIY